MIAFVFFQCQNKSSWNLSSLSCIPAEKDKYCAKIAYMYSTSFWVVALLHVSLAYIAEKENYTWGENCTLLHCGLQVVQDWIITVFGCTVYLLAVRESISFLIGYNGTNKLHEVTNCVKVMYFHLQTTIYFLYS